MAPLLFTFGRTLQGCCQQQPSTQSRTILPNEAHRPWAAHGERLVEDRASDATAMGVRGNL